MKMNDLFHAALKKIDHYRFTFISMAVVALVLGVAFGCQPKAKSPFTGKLATETQLRAEVQAYQAQLDVKVKTAQLTFQQTLAELEAEATAGQVNAQAALHEIEQRKQAIRLGLETLTVISSTAAGPQFAPLIGSAVGIAGVLLGAGAAADSARKDSVILAIKNPSLPTTPAT